MWSQSQVEFQPYNFAEVTSPILGFLVGKVQIIIPIAQRC